MGNNSLLYFGTNEDLGQIVGALDPNLGDRILAVCGSGDQAFALVEHGPKVIAFDDNVAQIRYAKKRTEMLKSEAHGFFSTQSERTFTGNKAKDYLSERGRLERIRANLPNISFLESDILSLDEDKVGQPNKIYMSNAIGHHYWGDRLEELHLITSLLPVYGLLYTTNGDEVKAMMTCEQRLADQFELVQALPPDDFNWNPMLFRKVGGSN